MTMRVPGVVAAVRFGLVTPVCLAQTFPQRPLWIVAPLPGGAADTTVRQIAPGLGEALGLWLRAD